MGRQANRAAVKKEQHLGADRWIVTLPGFWLRLRRQALDDEKWHYEAGGRTLNRVEMEMVAARVAGVTGHRHDDAHETLRKMRLGDGDCD
jgi:hypothetical protein